MVLDLLNEGEREKKAANFIKATARREGVLLPSFYPVGQQRKKNPI